MMQTPLSTRLVVLVLALLTGCASPAFRSDHDADFEFSAARTYAWLDGQPGATGDTPFTPLDNARFRAVAERELGRRGLEPVQSGEPDVWLRLSIDGSVLERPAVALPVASVANGFGGGYGGGFGGGFGHRGGFGYRSRGFGGFRFGRYYGYGYGYGWGYGYPRYREPNSFLALEMFSAGGGDPVWTGWTEIRPDPWRRGDPFARQQAIEDLVRGLLGRYPVGGEV